LIRLSVPGTLLFRDVAIRVVASACKLLRSPADEPEQGDGAQIAPGATGATGAGAEDFDSQVLSAFGEAFNNIAIHGYRGIPPGEVHIEIANAGEDLVIRIRDDGASFHFPDQVAAPEDLPERGMGLFIIRSFMDRVVYHPGPPNELSMTKRWPVEAAPRAASGKNPET
jgi:serine/threonine-protein kinase RsbW